jgi:hypothetical protein
MSLLLALTGGGGPATVTASGAAQLGGLTSATTATVTHNATGTADLGGLSATTAATVTHAASGTAALGELTGATTAVVTHIAAGHADLGALTASTTATGGSASTPDDGYTSHGSWPRAKKFPTPPRLPRIPNTVHASGSASLGALTAHTTAVATWSPVEDDEELLLLV